MMMGINAMFVCSLSLVSPAMAVLPVLLRLLLSHFDAVVKMAAVVLFGRSQRGHDQSEQPQSCGGKSWQRTSHGLRFLSHSRLRAPGTNTATNDNGFSFGFGILSA